MSNLSGSPRLTTHVSTKSRHDDGAGVGGNIPSKRDDPGPRSIADGRRRDSRVIHAACVATLERARRSLVLAGGAGPWAFGGAVVRAQHGLRPPLAITGVVRALLCVGAVAAGGGDARGADG